MAYRYNGKIIRAGKAWSNDEGIQHPRNWMIWSDAEKTAAGLVWEDDPAPFDSRFYWHKNGVLFIHHKGVWYLNLQANVLVICTQKNGVLKKLLFVDK